MSWTLKANHTEGLNFNHRKIVTSPWPPNQVSSRSGNRTEKALRHPHRPQAASSEHNDRASAAVSPLDYDTPQEQAMWGHCPTTQFLISEGSLETRELQSSHHKHWMAADWYLCFGYLVAITKFTSLLAFLKVTIHNCGNVSFQFFITLSSFYEELSWNMKNGTRHMCTVVLFMASPHSPSFPQPFLLSALSPFYSTKTVALNVHQLLKI